MSIEKAERYFFDFMEIEKLLSRVDERVQTLIKTQESASDKSDEAFHAIATLRTDLHKMELRVQELESNTSSQESRWKTIIGFAIQLVWVILAAFLLYKLGISAPAVP